MRRHMEAKRRRLARLRRLHRNRYLRRMRMRKARRAMAKKFKVRRLSNLKKRLLAANKLIANKHHMYKLLRRRIMEKIYEIRQNKDAKKTPILLKQLKQLINQSREIRRSLVKKAVKQNRSMKKMAEAKKMKKVMKKMLKEKKRIAIEKKFIRALNEADAKINALKHVHKFNAKKFQRASAKAIKSVCRHMKLSKAHCRKVAAELRGKVKHESKKISRRFAKKQETLRRNMHQKIQQHLVKRAVKKMAVKFERNYNVMDKHRAILDVTCRMDPANCHFFRRSFGDKVPMF